nr:MAG TPA: PROTEIN/DNA Complex catalytic motif, Helix-turn-helix DNA [Caudoviricetes sp.]
MRANLYFVEWYQMKLLLVDIYSFHLTGCHVSQLYLTLNLTTMVGMCVICGCRYRSLTNNNSDMSELYIPIERPERNLVNGRFLKGHTPHNKGKKWADYMDMRKAKRIKRIGVKNLVRNYRISGWNAKPVVAIKDDELVGIYPSASEAGRKAGICGRNIISCCSGKRKHAGGYQWFWENDNTWCNLINHEKYKSF